MAKIAGVKIEKNASGVPVLIQIDLRKYPELWTVFVEHGLIDESKTSPYSRKFVEQIRQSEQEESVSVNLLDYGIKV